CARTSCLTTSWLRRRSGTRMRRRSGSWLTRPCGSSSRTASAGTSGSCGGRSRSIPATTTKRYAKGS
ncbi:MAG: hypothetical protein AVDCRST_MAG58-1398, partial [uncultured Rubrobacteraceae bacterium]